MARQLDALATFLRETASSQKYGERDCALWVCDWVERKTGINPFLEFAAKYKRNALEEFRLLHEPNGKIYEVSETANDKMLALVSEVMAASGFAATTALESGDVALVDCSGRRLCAIKTATRLAAKTPTGIFSGPLPVVMAWRL